MFHHFLQFVDLRHPNVHRQKLPMFRGCPKTVARMQDVMEMIAKRDVVDWNLALSNSMKQCSGLPKHGGW